MAYKSIEVTVVNNTGNDLKLNSYGLDCGIWSNHPESILNNDKGRLMAKSYMGHLCVNGTVEWIRRSDQSLFKIHFEKYENDNKTRFSVNCSQRYRYTISGDPLMEHPKITVTFSEKDLRN